MAKYQRTGSKEEKAEAEASRRRKESPERPQADQAMTADGGPSGFPFRPPLERHAAELAGAGSDEQRHRIAMHLQRSYGNSYVQRLVNHMQLAPGVPAVQMAGPTETEAVPATTEAPTAEAATVTSAGAEGASETAAPGVTSAGAEGASAQAPAETTAAVEAGARPAEEPRVAALRGMWDAAVVGPIGRAYEALAADPPDAGRAAESLASTEAPIRAVKDAYVGTEPAFSMLAGFYQYVARRVEELRPHVAAPLPLEQIRDALNPSSEGMSGWLSRVAELM